LTFRFVYDLGVEQQSDYLASRYRRRLGGRRQPNEFDRGLVAIFSGLGQRHPDAFSYVVLGGKQDRGSCTEDHRGGCEQSRQALSIEVQKKANSLLPFPGALQTASFGWQP